MLPAERRTQQRFSLNFPLQVRLQTPSKTKAAHVQTLTRDISARGLYFTLSEPCEPGSPVECVLTLPAEFCQGKTVQIYCAGHVIRVEHPDVENRIGIGATIDRYEFLKSAD